jgi:hypothetical protein
MATKNDITGDSIVSKTNTDKYRDGFAAIFNRDKCERCGKTLFEDHLHTCAPKENKE